ncbi:transcriptional regulator [Acrocarpospora corrugata]|uniref:Transcriptional regulator n=1 Tax=Acrocarpospora corrugata TaxID=35763 RepID=A0A5M3VYY1_9ACTN|nr:helix-turn-helix transcriptional regulator [Acrocarpospora corrugata]GES02015.1 transcriptional regulator [Acrocarpospora corrugata]
MVGNGGNARMFLAQELRRAREAKGMSRTALAGRLYVSESLIKLWETGRRVPTTDDMEKLDDLFGMSGVLVRFRENFVKAVVPLEWFGRWLEVESRATALWSFELAVIPGLLQVEDYARAVLRAGEHNADLEDMVAARIARQCILTKEDEPPTLVALIAESVLRNNVGGPKVMVSQFEHLIHLAEQGDNRIIVQIIPASAHVCARFNAAFAIASFDSGEVAYLGNALRSEVVEATEDLVRVRRMFDVYRADALTKKESIAYISKVAEEWKSQI